MEYLETEYHCVPYHLFLYFALCFHYTLQVKECKICPVFGIRSDPDILWHYEHNWNLSWKSSWLTGVQIQLCHWRTTNVLTSGFIVLGNPRSPYQLRNGVLYSNSWHSADVSQLLSPRNAWLTLLPVFSQPPACWLPHTGPGCWQSSLISWGNSR